MVEFATLVRGCVRSSTCHGGQTESRGLIRINADVNGPVSWIKVVSVTAVKTETVVLADKSKPIVHHYKLGGDDPGLKDKWVCSALRDDPRKINIEVVDVLPPFNATVAEHEEARGSRLVTPSAQGGGVQHIWMDLSVETEEHISLEIVKSCGCSKGSTLCNTVSCGSLP